MKILNLIFIALIIFTTPCYAGVNFAMLSGTPEFNAFQSSQEAKSFAQNYAGNRSVVLELKRRIDENIHTLAELLDYPSDATVNEKLALMGKASKLSKQNEYYRIALKVIESSVGASVEIGAVPVIELKG